MKPRIKISFHDPNGVPIDTFIHPKRILETAALKRAMAHLAIELNNNGRLARRHGHRMVRVLSRLARAAEARGEWLQVNQENQVDSPKTYSTPYGLGLGIRAIKDNRIIWNISVFSCSLDSTYIHYYVPNTNSHFFAHFYARQVIENAIKIKKQYVNQIL